MGEFTHPCLSQKECRGLSDLHLQVHAQGEAIVCTAVLSLALSKQPLEPMLPASVHARLRLCLSTSATGHATAAS